MGKTEENLKIRILSQIIGNVATGSSYHPAFGQLHG